MLTELAITPQVFDTEANKQDGQWLDHVRELGRLLFPPGNVAMAIVSDLYDGSCVRELAKSVATIQDHRVKDYAQRLLPRIQDVAVRRPPESDWPEDEDGWVKEALATHQQEPIDRIIVTSDAYARTGRACRAVCSLADLDSDAFWRGSSAGRAVPMEITRQVDVLRPIWLHADFLAIISPYIYGKSTDEVDITVDLIWAMLNRPWHADRIVLDIHTEALGAAGSESLANQVSCIHDRFRRVTGKGGQLRLFLWPHFLERRLIAGDAVHSSGSSGISPKARWAIGFDHLARRGDNPDMTPAVWTLLSRSDTAYLYNRYYGQSVQPTHGPERLL